MHYEVTFSDVGNAAVWFWAQPWSVAVIISVILFPLAGLAMVSSKGLDFENMWAIVKFFLPALGWIFLVLLLYITICSLYA